MNSPRTTVMNKRMKFILSITLAAGMLVVAACTSTSNQAQSARRESGPKNGPTPIGSSQDSVGLRQESTSIYDSGSQLPQLKPTLRTYADAPEFELNDVLKAGRTRKLGDEPASRKGYGASSLLIDDSESRDDAGLAQLAAMYSSRCPQIRDETRGVHFASNEEIWVIQRYTPQRNAHPDDLTPGTGSMGCYQGEVLVPVPLKHTDVRATITGFISTVDVQQTFTNPYTSKIEAVYAFPLPENAAVNEIVKTIGDRHIRGIIRDKAEAEQIYNEARSQGHVASILNQERPNLFVQKVANIEPGKEIDISTKYYNTLAYSDGAYEFVFPMIIAPRYNPSGSDGIGAVPRGQARSSGQPTEISYLRPTERSGTDISLKVEIDAGVSIEKLESLSHNVEINRHGDHGATVELSRNDSIPNKDFVLRCYIAGSKMKSTLLTARDQKGDGVFALMLVPPRDLKSISRSAVEMVYVLDASGSMNGRPMEQAKAAIARSLKHLNADDTFQLINFAFSASQLGSGPLPATPANIGFALKYLDEIAAAGGTEMMNGLKASLDFSHDPHRMRYVTFLTDGLIGNESDIIREVHSHLGEARIFSFGVSSAPNRYLLDAMARVGSGGVAYLASEDSANEVMDAFDDRISHPALFDVKLDFGSTDVSDVYPSRIPDLCVDRPVIVTGHYRGHLYGPVRVTGRAGGVRMTTEISHVVDADRDQAKALPRIWANMKIQSLAERALWSGEHRLVPQAKATALQYSIMSPFTSFIAVDSLTKTQGTYGTTVQVPVAVPDGTSYDTTVGK